MLSWTCRMSESVNILLSLMNKSCLSCLSWPCSFFCFYMCAGVPAHARKEAVTGHNIVTATVGMCVAV